MQLNIQYENSLWLTFQLFKNIFLIKHTQNSITFSSRGAHPGVLLVNTDGSAHRDRDFPPPYMDVKTESFGQDHQTSRPVIRI